MSSVPPAAARHEAQTRLSPQVLTPILQAAVQAPSADNHHRIRFEPSASGLRIHHAGGGLAAPGGYRRALDLLSLGAVLENLTIAARVHGRSTDIRLFPDAARPLLLCEIAFAPAEPLQDPLWEQIPQRCTNRRLHYHGPPLGAPAMTTLQEAMYAGCTLYWLDIPAQRRRVLPLVRQAEAARFSNQALHADMFGAIRFDVGWQAACDEGLPPGALGVERPLRPAFALLRHWPLLHALNLIGGAWLLGWRAGWLPCRLTPHLCVIAVDTLQDTTLVAAGRSLQRLWLEASRLGLALQPMPAAALYAFEGAAQEDVPAALSARLRARWQTLLPSVWPVMLFRLGRAPTPPVRTGRPPLQAMMVTA